MKLKFLQRPFLAVCFLFVLLSGKCLAEIDPYENTLIGPFQNGASFTVKDAKFQNAGYNWSDITNFSVKDAVTLRVIDNVLIPYQFTYTVSLKIDYYTDPNSGPVSVNRELTVNYDPAQGVKYKGTDSYAFEGAYKVTVTVTGVNAHGGISPSGPVVQLSSNIVIDRQTAFQPQSSISPSMLTGDHNQLRLDWNFVPGAEEYDIEWTTINGGNDNFASVDQQQGGTVPADPEAYKAILNQIFRNNASRITTAKHDYTLSVLSTDTYFLLRIRQVQYSTDGVRLTGDWDYKNKSGAYAIIPINWNEPGLNWQYSAAFAEEGKKKEVISYFDGTLRSRQTVTLNNTDSVALAQENIYDEFGRKAASILPAPFKETTGKSYLHYGTNFNLNPAGTAYSFLNLQSGAAGCETAPDPLNVSSGASQYYSASSSFLTSADKSYNKFIPDAGGFPIAVTRFTDDNTGRIKLQGGVGPAFQPGVQNAGDASKTTKYYYGKPEQWELDQLFGNDVGYAEHYLKNMVVDPNGQISISYLNASGKTIATALTGAPPSNLNAIASYNPDAALKHTALLKPEQFVYNNSDLKLTATTTYLASVTGPGTLTYNIQKLVSSYPPGSAFAICSNCYYQMSVKVVNDCNEQVAGTSAPVQIGSMTANCADTARYQDSLVVPFNKIGEYHVTIEFAFNKDVVENYTDSFITQGQASGGVEKEFDYIKKRYLDSLDVSGCYADCRTCNMLLGGQADFVQMLKSKFIALDLDSASVQGTAFGTWAGNLYTTLKSNCTAIQGNCDLSPCVNIQGEMQDDVSPGGQYALFDAAGNAMEPDINVLTSISAGNTVPNWRVQFPVLAATDPLYQSELITLDDGSQTSPYDTGFTLAMLIKYWKTDWAVKFLIYHPEYCKLQFCQSMTAFENWDQQVQQFISKAAQVPSIPGGSALSYAPANSSDWMMAADPWFQPGAPGYAYRSQMSSSLLQYSRQVLGVTSSSAQVKGLISYNDYLLYCSDPNSATNTTPGSGDSWNNCTPSSDCRVADREWLAYRDGYFQLKEKFYALLRDASCSSSCTIGKPYVVTLPGDCPTVKDFSIRSYSAGSPACAGSQTVLLSYDGLSLSKAVTVNLYYPAGYDSASLPQTFQFNAGETQKNFCVPLDLDAATIAVKSVVCSSSAPIDQTPSSVGIWAYISKENDRVVPDQGSYYKAADFVMRIYKGGDATNHPDPISANAYNYSGDIAYTVEGRTWYLNVYNTSAHFSNQDAIVLNPNTRNLAKHDSYYAEGEMDLDWYFTANHGYWLYLTSIPTDNQPTQTPASTGSAASGSSSCITPSSSTNYWAESATKGINLITNGDFLSGNSGFSSAYNYIYPDGTYANPNATSSDGFYRFTTNPQLKNPAFYSFGDHTTGSGNMMLLDGGAYPAVSFWYTPINVTANQNYVFSFWGASLSSGSPANLQVTINGIPVGNTLLLTPNPSSPWLNYQVQWNAGSNTSAIIGIHDLNTDASGNDFAVDDLVFAPACVASSSCPEVFAYKQSRFPSAAVSSTAAITQAQGSQLVSDTKSSIAASAKEQFTAQSATWMAKLKPGLDQNNVPDDIRSTLQEYLVAISLAGSDLAHPYGSSTLPAGLNVNGFTSFGDAIKGMLNLSQFTPSLNPWLIGSPFPYTPLQQSTEKTISATSNELCSLLSSISSQAQASGMDMYTYLVSTYKEAMTLSPAQLSSLRNSCNNCRFILPEDLTLPVFMEPGSKGCITAADYQAAKQDLDSQFGGNLSSSDSNYETIFSNFMDHRWGFSLTYDNYKNYEALLASNPDASLCNQRPYTAVDSDPYACIKSAMEAAVANGEKDYQSYITEQKNAFRANYISTCSLAQASAGLSANQQIYHYTLYYYDQADNLIRTVPPEGVTLLSENELRWVKQARDNGSGTDCSYTGPKTNADKTQAFQALSDMLSANTPQAMEFWLYNASGTSNQLLLTTPDRKYMMQVCISGKFLNLDMYAMQPGQPQNSATMTNTNHFVADVSQLLPLQPWSHVVVQGQDLAGSGTLNVYLNGKALAAQAGGPSAVCGWTIDGNSNPVQAADNITTLKHLRLYTGRTMDAVAEIPANAQNNCFNPANTANMQWFRFNVPDPGTATTYLAGSTDETRLAPVFPAHALVTTYAYNTHNQVIRQTSPDGGTNRFWYDLTARPVISQNDKQLAVNDYSYTAYDVLGRITEVGQKRQATITLDSTGYRIEGSRTPKFLDAGTNSQITQTVYDAQPVASNGIPSGLVQENLRKRVAASLYRESQGAPVLRASYYNYDIDGNVKTLTQQTDGLGLKKIGYEYDLISGKVNFVRYQDGSADQFYYKYNYDAENRLTDAWSGTAALVDTLRGSSLLPHNQKLDAHYDYYLHGPLARTELGDVYGKVQGTDYAYTLQGWLKGMNSNGAGADEDMGADGTAGTHSTIARDAHAMSLFYYGNDYSTISGATPFLNVSDYLEQGTGNENFMPLYNGNIAASTNKLTKLNDQHFKAYRYDQLNRLNNVYVHGINVPYSMPYYPILNETFSYDGNGNILTALRTSTGPLAMDDLSYGYNRDAGGRLLNNKLRHVKDAVGLYEHPDDLDNQDDDDNYRYDAIGNLVHDTQEGIDNIDWTVYGKIRSISKTDGTQISYAYNPSGQRVSKTVNGSTTWYVRDAQGNTMGLYDNRNGASNWREQHLYGSSRLGIWQPNVDLGTSTGTAAWDTIGNKSYELTNHLGNVMAAISDKRLQHSSDGTNIDYFDADVQSAQEYYAFGAIIKGTAYNAPGSGYRYGFNGKENDNEVKKDQDGNNLTGGQQDYGMRIYDGRLGKFLSVDPLSEHYPWYTPYSFGGNSPVKFIDLDGKEEYDPTNDAFFVGKLIMTTFYDVKHSSENLILRAFPADPGKRWLATYKVENGHQVFETVIRQVPKQGAVKELLNTGLDAANVLLAGKGATANSFDASILLAETSGEAQITRAAREGLSAERSVLRLNQEAGYIREAEELASLKLQNPRASIQQERYLRDANGRIVKDPVTGEGRRIDFAVIEDGQVKRLVETTSLTASKTAQTFKENRIRAAGGSYIRDQKTRKLIDVSKVRTEISRRQ